MITHCPLTNIQLTSSNSTIFPTTRAGLEYEFEPVGRVFISEVARARLNSLDKLDRSRIAGMCRAEFEKNHQVVELTSRVIEEALAADLPRTVKEKANHFISLLYQMGGKDYEDISFSSSSDYTMAFATDEAEFNKIVKLLERQGLIRIDNELGMAGHRVDYCDVSLTDAGIQKVQELQKPASKDAQANPPHSQKSSMDIFISHSSHDAALAQALIELIRSSLNISADKIRCSSVEGYKFPAGVDTDEQIRKEVFETKVLIGLISPNSVSSMYVAFELGARWSIKQPLVPVTSSKLGHELLKGPLKGINALNLTVRADVLQLVTDLGRYLGIIPQSASVYDRNVNELVQLSLEETLPTPEEAKLNEKIASGFSTEEFADAEAIIKQHCTNSWPSDFSMQAYCMTEQRNAVSELKSLHSNGVPREIFLQIRRKAAADWPTDFTMRLYAEKEQLDSYRKLHS